MSDIRISQPLQLDGAKNVRDLGGYPAQNGITAKKVFLRADGLQNLSDSDITKLVHYGVCRIIDLRSDREAKYMPDRAGTIACFHVGMLDQMNSAGFNGDGPESMFSLYQSLLDHSAEQISKVIHLLAEVKNGVSLFHCTAGKDRTGVVTMLLMDLAGVPAEYIIADYSVTETYMKDIFAQQKEQARANGIEIKDYMLRSNPEDMECTLTYLHQKYTDAQTYLLDYCHCSKEDINSIRKRFLCTNIIGWNNIS
ncbi:MAG: tyrosine-protein phosphatase [Lachnospiraceae bacterium]|nr:tyrosine-protein phosphatase [Lachnospiraceae bacterium]